LVGIKILKISNSAFYAVDSVVTTLEKAVVHIGFNGVREIATGLAVLEQFRKPKNSGTLDRVKLWETGTPEPRSWDVEFLKEPSDVHQGGALLIAHYSEVTFGDVEVLPV